VLAQRTDPIFGPNFGDTYILATYVKWLESGGARVVPIRVKESDEYYEKLFKSINGLVIPGGIVSIETSYYAKTARLLYNMAVKANNVKDYFPVWGTCRGFQQLTALTSGKNLVSTTPSYTTMSLNLTHSTYTLIRTCLLPYCLTE
ncbi:gamma-glutamyl hydrolase-like, partial [Argopecten irradians]|uniref:gamma-glutamyl hydrolase-like n=1 Tax=Argopecten irradians TaxID=31199 RepID=UPI00371FF6D2